MKYLILFIGLFIHIELINAQNTGWNFANPVSEGKDLRSVDFLNETLGFAVGTSGTILQTTNGGNTWLKLARPTSQRLNSVCFIEGTGDVVVAGDNGTILKKPAGTSTWSVQNIPQTVRLNEVVFLNQSIGIIVGDFGKILRTTDGGSSWNSVNSGTTFSLHAITHSEANTLIAVGDNGIILRGTNNGSTWSLISSPTDQPLVDVAFSSTLIGVAISENGTMIRTTDGGLAWNLLPPQGGNELGRITFFNSTSGVVVGRGVVLVSADQGASWVPVTDHYLSESLFGVVAVNNQKAIAVGYKGTIIETLNAGNNWTYKSGGILCHFYGICARTANDVTVIGDRGFIFKSSDGGSLWNGFKTGPITLLGVDFADEQIGYAVGYDAAIYKTSNAGSSWEQVYSNGLFFWMNDIRATSPTTATTIGQGGRILNTSDGGQTWNLQPTTTGNNLYGLDFVSSQVGFAVGENGTILRTTNGGQVWELQNSGFPNSVLFSVSFLDENNGVAAGGTPDSLYSLILKTTNGGVNWTKINQTVIENNIAKIQFVSPTVITAVNQNSTLVRSTDAGLSWTVQFNDPSVLSFYALSFADALNGYAVGQDGVILKTTDGGITFVKPFQGVSNAGNFLSQNYPNPFSESTTIHWKTPAAGWQTVKVYDFLGKEVATLVDGFLPAGQHEIVFNPKTQNKGTDLKPGFYFYQLMFRDNSGKGVMDTKKMLLINE